MKEQFKTLQYITNHISLFYIPMCSNSIICYKNLAAQLLWLHMCSGLAFAHCTMQIKIYNNYTLPHRAKVTTKYILYFRPISKYHKARYNVTEFTVLKHMHISIKKEHIINEYKFISCAFRKL